MRPALARLLRSLPFTGGIERGLQRWTHEVRRWRALARRPAFFPLDSLPRLPADSAGEREGFVELIPAAASHASRTDLPVPPGWTSADLRRAHQPPRPIHALGYYALHDVTFGGEGQIRRGSKVCYSPTIMPAYVRRDPTLSVSFPARPIVREIARPVILFSSRDYNSYGHWWLDLAPRLDPLWRHRPDLLRRCALVIPDDLAPWARETLHAAYGIEPASLVTYRRHEEVLRCARAIVPTLLHHDSHFHPAADAFYRRMMTLGTARVASPGPGRRLFITRRRQARARVLANIVAVEALAASLGFVIVAPEELSWAEQIALFAQAEIVVGEHGSAMKNLLFSPPETLGVVINWLNETQSTLAALKRQRCIVVPTVGFDPFDFQRPFSVDIAGLESCLRSVLSAAPSPATQSSAGG